MHSLGAPRSEALPHSQNPLDSSCFERNHWNHPEKVNEVLDKVKSEKSKGVLSIPESEEILGLANQKRTMH